ncbi:hypothetical protein GALMADRAFT_1112358 [Galerina marginata CBS 339.88]|uniref:Uncharacterized protein n=1 Tax=Galerina marginata (strain CBS 339.88) TaxID=685588 RepID=A0A067TCC0_GALM3|nr:hypothetical protein GALMADRAFT_1112358 [Galerina marginata CBS 339.88]
MAPQDPPDFLPRLVPHLYHQPRARSPSQNSRRQHMWSRQIEIITESLNAPSSPSPPADSLAWRGFLEEDLENRLILSDLLLDLVRHQQEVDREWRHARDRAFIQERQDWRDWMCRMEQQHLDRQIVQEAQQTAQDIQLNSLRNRQIAQEARQTAQDIQLNTLETRLTVISTVAGCFLIVALLLFAWFIPVNHTFLSYN